MFFKSIKFALCEFFQTHERMHQIFGGSVRQNEVLRVLYKMLLGLPTDVPHA